MDQNTQPAQPASAISALYFGNGLAGIFILTTFIGSKTAADLALGNRGSAGLVWGLITTFGSSSVIKACIGAASPSWLRHILGLRTTVCDTTVGMDLPLSPSLFAQSARYSGQYSPLGVSYNSGYPNSKDEYLNASFAANELPGREVLAFDRTTSILLERLTITSTTSPLVVHILHSTLHSTPFQNGRIQVATLGLSMLKLFEIYFLFVHGGALLGYSSAIPFSIAFLAATFTEIYYITVSKEQIPIEGCIDIAMGSLPTTKRAGGPKKILLGAMQNSKLNIWWRAYWAIIALTQTISLLTHYLLLGRQTINIIATWTAFQVAWVALRTLVYHFTDCSNHLVHGPLHSYDLPALPHSMKMRLVNLAGAVGTYQMNIHPRGIQYYTNDTFSSGQIYKFLAASNMFESYDLPKEYTDSHIQLNVIAIIGDTFLSSAAWIAGLNLTPMDLYDTCIVVLSEPSQFIGQSPRTISIPAARVFSSTSKVTDSELAEPIFVPRGAGPRSQGDDKMVWIYWIPCQSGRWIQIESDNQSVLGQVSAYIMDDKQLSSNLSAGRLNIDLKGAEDVKEIIHLSRKATNCVRSMLY